jgi:hypothetical protein
MGEGQEENAIVTSTGNYVVAWDFAKVKKGQLDKYEIKKYVWLSLVEFSALIIPVCRYTENVVQDNFMFGDDKHIVSSYTATVASYCSTRMIGGRAREQCRRCQQEEFEAPNAAVSCACQHEAKPLWDREESILSGSETVPSLCLYTYPARFHVMCGRSEEDRLVA